MAWPFYWQREAAPALGGSALPAVSDGFARFVAAPHITDALNKGLEKTLLEAKTNPCDTHPPLRDRIAVAEKLPGLSVQEETELATTLLERLQELELRFVENRISSIKPGSLKYVSWDDVALTATIPAWQKVVTEHAEVLKGVTAESILTQLSKLHGIGSRIPEPQGMLLTPGQRTERAGQLFALALALALIENRWELNVQPGIFQPRRGADYFNPFVAVAELMAGKRSHDGWIQQCKTFGISQLKLSAAGSVVPVTQSLDTQPTLFDPEAIN